jgi:transcriptional regulator with XRE-family HTH domain
MEVIMNLSERLSKLLNEFGWSYYKLAKIAGLPRSTVEHLVKGSHKTTSHENIQKIAAAFNITVTELIGEETPEIINLEDSYIEVAKEAQDKKIDPEKLRALIKLITEDMKK